MLPKPLPPQDVLNELFVYSIITGQLWRRSTGKIAGWFEKSNGYRCVEAVGERYLVHRIIWKMITGEDAPFIDHENLDKIHNGWINLRDCTKTENQGNRTARVDNQCGHKGIHWDDGRQKWVVQIKKHDVRYMRRTRTLAGAIALHRLKSGEMYGQFARSA